MQTLEQSIPQNQIVEQALLSCLIQNINLLPSVPGELFWAASHRQIYEGIRRMAAHPNLKVVEFPALVSQFENGHLAEVGGREYLNELWDYVPTWKNWANYRDQLDLCRRHREAVMTAMAIERAETPLEAIQEAEKLAKSTIMVPRSIRGIKEVLWSLMDRVEDRRAKVGLPEVHFGIPPLDDLLWIERKDQVVICAQTGEGKTALAIQAVINSPASSWAIFSMEIDAETIAARMIANRGSVAIGRLRSGRLKEDEFSKITHVMDEISKRKIWIDDSPTNIAQIELICRALQRSEGLDAIVVDYLQLVKPSNKKDNREQQVAEISGSLKRLAMDLGIVVIAMSQLNDDGKVRESRAIIQDCNLALKISADKISIIKHRDGPVSVIPIKFNGAFNRFEAVKNESFGHEV